MEILRTKIMEVMAARKREGQQCDVKIPLFRKKPPLEWCIVVFCHDSRQITVLAFGRPFDRKVD
jgi:hypothetical protein